MKTKRLKLIDFLKENKLSLYTHHITNNLILFDEQTEDQVILFDENFDMVFFLPINISLENNKISYTTKNKVEKFISFLEINKIEITSSLNGIIYVNNEKL